MKQYPGVRYREDGAPLNDLERIMHNDKDDKAETLSLLVEIRDRLLDLKVTLTKQ